MPTDSQDASEPMLTATLAPTERIEVIVQADGARLAVTDQRVLVAAQDRLLLDVPIAGLRRMQLDIERGRPGSLGIVPESLVHEPQILTVLPQAYDDVARAIAFVGHRLEELTGA